MRDVLVVLFWIWLLVALGVYGYRIYRRLVRGPRTRPQPGAGDVSPAAQGTSAATGPGPGRGGLLGRLAQPPAPPLPEGPVEARLPRSLQDVPPPAGSSGSDPTTTGPPPVASAPAGEASEGVATPPRASTLAEALRGITMPEDLLPVVDPSDPDVADDRRARFGATGTNVPAVAGALANELQRLGYAVDGLDTITSGRAGLTATRDGTAVAATVQIDDDTGAVIVDLRI